MGKSKEIFSIQIRSFIIAINAGEKVFEAIVPSCVVVIKNAIQKIIQ